MIKNLLLSLLASLFLLTSVQAQVFHGTAASKVVPGAEKAWVKDGETLPSYVALRPDARFDRSQLLNWLGKSYGFDESYGLEPLNAFRDQLGQEHFRYKLTFNGYEIHDGMIIAHCENDMVYAVNGSFPVGIVPANAMLLSEQAALSAALSHIGAQRYKWEMPEEEAHLREIEGDPLATYYPLGEMVLLPKVVDGSKAHHYAWKFNVYADSPLYRKDIFIDAATGQVLLELDEIHEGDVQGTAVTRYSGTRTITTDSVSANLFRLRESDRGNGIETFNLQNGTSYGAAVDFTDSDNYWNNVNTAQDEVATDAHWGAEMTYDYYLLKHNRNSIDDNGFKLRSYVHYSSNYANAFWDGQRMTYGDGNGSWSPLTALDICAHEITHGLTSFTADLDYAYESGAMNEAYSDIFGVAIEWYGKPTMANWTMGENIGSTLRSMSNPNQYGDPDTYLGNYYYIGTNDNGGVHTNSGVLNYWFYLAAHGGSGTNDNNDQYSVTGIGLDSAGAVAYRTLVVYLVNTSQYADARFYSILSAMDLFGPCSPQVQTVTNAMYAVGIGAAYVPGVQADFSADILNFCAPPASVTFTNLSNNGSSFAWDFGDTTSSTQTSPTHTYTNYGSFPVTLIADGGACGSDTTVKTAYISIDPSNPCITFMPQSGLSIENGCSGKLYDSGGTGNYPNNSNSTIVISPFGASSVTLQFLSFGFESGYDYLSIYDGPNSNSPLIGQYDGTSLPNGGTIVSTGSSLTLVQESDQGVTDIGFELNWSCSYPTAPPVSAFTLSDTVTCDGVIDFRDMSSNGPSTWHWDFGDGSSSTNQHPTHTYANNGMYDITLVTSNSFGSDTIEMLSAVRVDMPLQPIAADQAICNSGSVTFQASSNGQVRWYDSYPNGTLLDTGLTFTTPNLSASTDYYCESVIAQPLQSAAKPDNSGSGGYYSFNSSHWLVFDTYTDIVLKSVLVYAQSAGNRTITLRSSNGSTIDSKTVYIPSGQQRVDLDFVIPAGTDYELAGPPSPGLYRNNGGTSYPYVLNNVLSVKYSSATTNPTGYYYFFYDWEVQQPECSSPVTTVTAHVHNGAPQAAFTFTNNDPDVDFSDNSVDGAFYAWDFGDGQGSALKAPTHVYNANGTYTVTLIVSNGCGSDTITQNVVIQTVGFGEADDAFGFHVYPVPASEVVNVSLSLEKGSKAELSLLDPTGRVVRIEALDIPAGGFTHAFPIHGLASGFYLLKVEGDELRLSKPLVIR